MVIVGYLENIGVFFFFLYRCFLYFGLDHRAVIMLPDFR